MPDSEVEQIARFLATHAMLLLGLGIMAAAGSVAVLVSVIRLAARLRPAVERILTPLVRRVQTIDAVRRVGSRAAILVPSVYLAVHLALGLLVVIFVGFFTGLAEDVIGGGELASFDVIFARALYEEQTPGWRQFFSVVSLLGTGYAIAIATAAVAITLLI